MQFVQNSTNINTPTIGSTAGVAIVSNPARVFFQIQNIGANPLYVAYGQPTASAANCHEVLKAGSAALDGNGGIAKSGTVVYTGQIAVGGTGPSFTSIEIAP